MMVVYNYIRYMCLSTAVPGYMAGWRVYTSTQYRLYMVGKRRCPKLLVGV